MTILIDMAEDFSNNFSKEDPDLIIGICSACEKEEGIDQKPYTDKGWSVSSGICSRHAEKFLRAANIPEDRIKERVKAMTTRDLSDPKNKPLVDWLKNPPLSPTKQKQAKPA